MYRPFVWEYSRLNVTRNIVSKRKLSILVNRGYVKGWDDPRLLTLNGLRRRGYTPQAINDFIDHIGVTRRGNENVISVTLLENCLRKIMDKEAKRTMAVLKPIKIILRNLSEDFVKIIEVADFPKEPKRGKNNIILTKEIFIDKDDFREENAEGFYGLSSHKEVGLKYAGIIKCLEVNKLENGDIKEIICEYLEIEKKTPSRIHWISYQDAIKCEIRLYDYLFTTEYPNESDDFLACVNKNSLMVHSNSLINKNLLSDINSDGVNFQFERLGYFVTDKDSDFSNRRIVFNLSVDLAYRKTNAK